jgi:hypothetical protein
VTDKGLELLQSTYDPIYVVRLGSLKAKRTGRTKFSQVPLPHLRSSKSQHSASEIAREWIDCDAELEGQDDGKGASRIGNFPSCFFALSFVVTK